MDELIEKFLEIINNISVNALGNFEITISCSRTKDGVIIFNGCDKDIKACDAIKVMTTCAVKMAKKTIASALEEENANNKDIWQTISNMKLSEMGAEQIKISTGKGNNINKISMN